MKNFSQESGRSMIEMLGVLAIIGVLSVGGIAGYSMAMSKFKTTKAIDEIQTITTNVRTLVSAQRKWPKIKETSIWYSLGVLTDEEGQNALGGNVEIDTETSAATHDIVIKYTGVPKDACIKMATTDWGDSSNVKEIKIGSNAYNWTSNNLPVELTEAVGKCETTNTLEWSFK